MDIFEANEKAGCAVGLRLVVTDENGEKISGGKDMWYGFERAMANQFAIDVVEAVEGVIESYREMNGEHKRVEEFKKQLQAKTRKTR